MCECLGGKPERAMKVKVSFETEVGTLFHFVGGAPSTDHDSTEKDLSLSIHIGTRKMVNYA